jgi:hypothetical protein
VREVVSKLVSKDSFIDSVAMVIEAVKAADGHQMKAPVVRAVMKNMGMRYRKVSHISM